MSFLISAAVGSMSLFGYSVLTYYGGNRIMRMLKKLLMN